MILKESKRGRQKKKKKRKQSFSRYTFAKKYSMYKETLKIARSRTCKRIFQCVVEEEYERGMHA
uniref:Uncharacterized protein n=1 Tax=Leersia perrieri TaxID=77586 RepID=A0A0D9WR85_9ORYZ